MGGFIGGFSSCALQILVVLPKVFPPFLTTTTSLCETTLSSCVSSRKTLYTLTSASVVAPTTGPSAGMFLLKARRDENDSWSCFEISCHDQ